MNFNGTKVYNEPSAAKFVISKIYQYVDEQKPQKVPKKDFNLSCEKTMWKEFLHVQDIYV